jgi:hypothetical protein
VRLSSVLFGVIVIIFTISLVCIWFYPSIQDFAASNNMWNGIKSATSELEADTINSYSELPDLSEKTVLVTIPYLDYSDEELSQIRQFIETGGKLILMDDYGYGNRILDYLGVGIRFNMKPLLDPLFCYRNQWMPRITDFSPQIKDGGIKVVMLNHATALTNVGTLEVLASSSSTSFLDLNDNGSWGEGEPKGPFPIAAGFRLGKGTVNVVSDPSIMINSVYGRDDNYLFMKYLTGYQAGTVNILIDSSHLAKAPLDVSKTRLLDARRVLSNPYTVLGILALVFLVVSGYTVRKGEIVDIQ